MIEEVEENDFSTMDFNNPSYFPQYPDLFENQDQEENDGEYNTVEQSSDNEEDNY